MLFDLEVLLSIDLGLFGDPTDMRVLSAKRHLVLLLGHALGDRRTKLKLAVHVPNEGKEVRVLAPAVHFDANE